MRHSLLLGIPILIFALALISIHTMATSPSIEADFDSDGMADAYELFFGLDPSDPDDASLDSDGDRFGNLQESAQLTDPFAPDTDRDEFKDNEDASPISRAYIQWGAPQFTKGDQYDYAHPDWMLRAYKTGGEWICETLDKFVPPNAWSTNAPQAYNSAWYFSARTSNDVGSLSIDLDRTILTNNLVYAVHYWDQPGASLYVDLLDTNGTVIAENLYGNLMTGTNEDAVVYLYVPTALFSNAAVIHLRSGFAEGDLSGVVPTLREVGTQGETIVFEGLLYIDEDMDGLDNMQEIQIGTSDYSVDTDGDGISDYQACFHTTNTNNPVPKKPVIDPVIDDDDDKDQKGIIYVDQARGNDTFTGRASSISGKKKGPKKTIRKGMSAVDADGAHTLIIKSGTYNENLDIRGKNVKVVMEGNVKL